MLTTMLCSMSRYILIGSISLAFVANSVESGFVTSTSGSRFVKRSGVRSMAVPLDTMKVSRQAECVLRCMRRPGCHNCNLGPINNVTKNRACELLSGENISPVTGGAAADWTMLFGKLTHYTVPSHNGMILGVVVANLSSGGTLIQYLNLPVFFFKTRHH